MPITTQMLLSPPNDFLFFLPQTKPKPLLHPHVFTIFPKPLFKVPSLLPNHPLCLSTSTTEALPQSAIERIAQKLRSLGYVEEVKESDDLSLSFTKGSSPGQIFVPIPTHLPKHRVGSSLDPSWSTPENPVPEPGSGTGIQRFHELRRTVKKERIEEKSKVKEILPTLAELTLPKGELRRLRTIGIGLEKSLKVGKAGITEGIVNGIHERWRRNEVIKIVCEDICRMNMKRTHDLLERKTGGLVVWRSGSKIVLYRGVDYKYPYFIADDDIMDDISNEASPDQLEDRGTDEGSSSDNIAGEMDLLSSERNLSRASLIQGVGVPNRVRFQLPGEAQIAQEADTMLDGLGPRFNDWWGYEPLPVDADLLPAVVPGYRRPFRMLPYGVKPKLTNDEMSVLKRLGRPLPCHFALGRNRKLQGLAVAILKLWEKCEIAKIAVKRGVQNTNSSLMAEELKKLTGGILLSRDKHFIVLYRGKDFLPAAVSSAIEARRKQRLVSKEKGTEQNSYVVPNATENEQWAPEDSLESENLGDMDLNTHHDVEERKLRFEEAAIERPNVKLDHDVEEKKLRSEEAAIERTTVKLSEALAKKEKAEKLLAELDSEVVSQQPEIDKEGLTKEERYMLRRVGMRMKPFLLMGRRGVFAGTIENMHLHWKYRELVKIICGAKSVKEALDVARTLEAESGGILIAVERVSKGYAIIVYRGKNYTRPASLRPDTLLTKREAMKRSIEAQRRKSLQLHVLKLAHNIDDLKLRLDKDTDRNGKLLSEDLSPEMVPSCTGYIKTQADLGIEVKSQVEEHETDTVQSAENKMDVTSSEALSQATSCTSFTEQVKNETRIARDLLEDDYTPESEPPSKPPSNGSENTSNTNESKTTSFPDFFEKCSQRSSSDIIDTLPQNLDIRTVGFTESKQTELRLSVDRVSKDKCQTLPCRVSRLSNKERLQLRKQALMVKRRPLFSIGKSNVVEGVAKALKSHFQKHPLAIVNVKGRAKGTSVQEVVVKLEEATGALFVSEEPSKVILYRGWGAEEEVNNNTSRTEKRNRRSTGTYTNAEENREDQKRYIASPELISAIKLECGLLHSASTS